VSSLENSYNRRMEIIRIDSKDNDSAVETTIRALKKGKVLACPTDTVYGLIADATNEEAVKRVFAIKGRSDQKPLSVFVRNIAMARKLAYITKAQESLLRKEWPGRFTAVLESRKVLSEVFEKEGKIGLRMPDYEFLDVILKKINRPLIGTSANVSGESSCLSAKEVIAQFEKRKYRPDIVLNAGKLLKARPSRVIDITGDGYKVIRK